MYLARLPMEKLRAPTCTATPSRQRHLSFLHHPRRSKLPDIAWFGWPLLHLSLIAAQQQPPLHHYLQTSTSIRASRLQKLLPSA